MGTKRPNATERRLSRVRALKAEFFADEMTVDEQLAAKDARIVELEREVEILRLRVERQRPAPEQRAPVADAKNSEPRFDFYRD